MVQKTASQPGAAKGRPRSFDTDEVLRQVRDAFLRYGFSGTSMDQLASATGLHKPSLYGAFGDKKQLYLRALDQYLDEVRLEIGAALSQPRLIDSLRQLIDGSIKLFTRQGGGGCFMMSTAVPEAREDPEISQFIRDAMDSLEHALVRRLEKAADAGEISRDADPRALAMILVANHYDLSARARAGYPVKELQDLGDRTIKLVCDIGGISRGEGPA